MLTELTHTCSTIASRVCWACNNLACGHGPALAVIVRNTISGVSENLGRLILAACHPSPGPHPGLGLGPGTSSCVAR